MRRQPQQRSERGHAMLEFALGFALLFPAFTGVFQFGYAFYNYNNLENAIRGAARYAAMRTYDSATSTPSEAYRTAVENMVLYGNPAGAQEKIVPVSRSNIRVQVYFVDNVPTAVRVDLINYSLDAFFTTYQLNGKPRVTFPYLGRWDPVNL